ncbi:MAG: PD40 domain-containing protein, partial [Flavobacteriales bacterium]|nr:PD40 domain-containing protein [Flavobacteriales bacterium]
GPFLSSDGKTLYFSSKGHEGIGGYDFFKSELVNDNWSTPVNMGIPFNSPADDIYLVMQDNNEIGFFSSNREGNLGAMDIYGFDISCPNIENTELRGIVYNKSNKLPLEATLALINTDNKTVNETKSLAENGKFLMIAPPENTYKLTVNAVGFNSQTVNVTIPKQCEFYPLFSEIMLENIKKDGQDYQVATLRNSFFNTADAIAKAQKDGDINTSQITNEVPLNKTANDKDFEHDKLLMALTRTIDTSNTNLAYTIISDTIKVDKPDTTGLITFYQEFFGYNIREVNTNHPDYIKMIEGALIRIKATGKISIDIESSASKVPTKTFKSNINLASLRGDEAKAVILKSLTDKGVNADNIEINKINSIVSGPRYTGDYKNTEKYHKFQYVKITIK